MRQALGPGALGGPGGSGCGGRIGMGKTCVPKAFSFQCMTKFTTIKKKKRLQTLYLIFPKSIRIKYSDSPLHSNSPAMQ